LVRLENIELDEMVEEIFACKVNCRSLLFYKFRLSERGKLVVSFSGAVGLDREKSVSWQLNTNRKTLHKNRTSWINQPGVPVSASA